MNTKHMLKHLKLLTLGCTAENWQVYVPSSSIFDDSMSNQLPFFSLNICALEIKRNVYLD